MQRLQVPQSGSSLYVNHTHTMRVMLPEFSPVNAIGALHDLELIVTTSNNNVKVRALSCIF